MKLSERTLLCIAIICLVITVPVLAINISNLLQHPAAPPQATPDSNGLHYNTVEFQENDFNITYMITDLSLYEEANN